MNGELAEAVALVSYGNAFLKGVASLDARCWSEHSTFRYVRAVRFVDAGYRWGFIPRRNVVATSPDAWFLWLESQRTSVLRLMITVQREWVIQTLAARRVVAWRSRMRYIGNKADGRTWNVTYMGSMDAEYNYRPLLNIPAAAGNLKAALEAITAFARSRELSDWEQRFTEARSILDASSAVTIPYHADLLAVAGAETRQLAAASAAAWVFGGMGSWSDIRSRDRRHDEYDAVTRQLYVAVLDGLAAAANAH